MASEGLSTPSGMGGLVRYNEEYPSKFRISPEMVIIIIAVVVIGITIVKLIS